MSESLESLEKEFPAKDSDLISPDTQFKKVKFRNRIAIVSHSHTKNPAPIKVDSARERPTIPAKESEVYYFLPDSKAAQQVPQSNSSHEQDHKPQQGSNPQQMSGEKLK